jgi:hypothetical protein
MEEGPDYITNFSTTVIICMGNVYTGESAEHAHYISTASLNEFH